jgi:hypothetical protein
MAATAIRPARRERVSICHRWRAFLISVPILLSTMSVAEGGEPKATTDTLVSRGDADEWFAKVAHSLESEPGLKVLRKARRDGNRFSAVDVTVQYGPNKEQIALISVSICETREGAHAMFRERGTDFVRGPGRGAVVSIDGTLEEENLEFSNFSSEGSVSIHFRNANVHSTVLAIPEQRAMRFAWKVVDQIPKAKLGPEQKQEAEGWRRETMALAGELSRGTSPENRPPNFPRYPGEDVGGAPPYLPH